MEYTPVTSSNIKEIAFENGKLYVRFLSEQVYSYDSSEEEFKHFLEAESKGRFFNQNIKGRFFLKETENSEIKEPTKTKPWIAEEVSELLK